VTQDRENEFFTGVFVKISNSEGRGGFTERDGNPKKGARFTLGARGGERESRRRGLKLGKRGLSLNSGLPRVEKSGEEGKQASNSQRPKGESICGCEGKKKSSRKLE